MVLKKILAAFAVIGGGVAFADSLSVTAPQSVTSPVSYDEVLLYDKLTVGPGGSLNAPTVQVLGADGGLVMSGGAVANTLKLLVPADTDFGAETVDALRINSGSVNVHNSKNSNAATAARVLFNGGAVRASGFGGTPFCAENGATWILEATGGHDIVFGDLGLQRFSWLTGTGKIVTRGNGNVVIHDNNYNSANDYRGMVYMNVTTTADWWKHAGNFVLSNDVTVVCQKDNSLPFGADTGNIEFKWVNRAIPAPRIDLGGKSVTVNGVNAHGVAGVIYNTTGTATLTFGADGKDGELRELTLTGGNIKLTKTGAGTTTATLGASTVNDITVSEGTLTLRDGTVIAGKVTVAAGATLVLDGALLKATSAVVLGTLEKANGGDLALGLAGGATLYDAVCAGFTAIVKDGAGQGLIQLPEVFAGDLRVNAGSVIFSGRQCTNEWYKWELIGAQQSGTKQIALGNFCMYSDSTTQEDLAKGITPGSSASSLGQGQAVASFATTTTKPSGAQCNLWDIRNLFDGAIYNAVISKDAYTLSQSASQWVILRLAAGKNRAGCYLPANSYVTWHWHPGSWILWTSPDGVHWKSIDTKITQYRTSGGALNNGVPYLFNLKGMVFPNAYGLAAGAKVSVASGASVDFANVGGGQTLSKIEVDCAAGGGTIANFSAAETGTLYLTNVSDLRAFVDTPIPVTLNGVGSLANIKNWTLVTDGAVNKKFGLRIENGMLYLTAPGMVITVR